MIAMLKLTNGKYGKLINRRYNIYIEITCHVLFFFFVLLKSTGYNGIVSGKPGKQGNGEENRHSNFLSALR